MVLRLIPQPVLPASAGMIHGGFGRTAGNPGAPRIRGDGPEEVMIRKTLFGCSPHPRG